MNKIPQIGLILSVFLIFGALIPPINAQNNAPTHATDSLQIAGKHLSFGHTRLKNKQYEEAESQLLKAWAHLPSQEQTLKKRSQCARLLGRLYHQTEKYDQAIQWYQKTVTLTPDSRYNKNTYRTLGNLYLYQEKPAEAIAAFEKLLTYTLKPAVEIETLYHLVVLTSEAQDFERALQYANRWAKLAPDDARVQDLLAKLHLRTGGEEEAIVQMEKVMMMNPDDFKTLNALATHYQNRGEFEKAFDAYEKLHQNDAQNFLYLEKLRTLSSELKKTKKHQLSILKKMHHLQPDNLAIIESLADQTEEEKWIQKGLQLDANNARLQFLTGELFYKKWKTSKAAKDSSNAMLWYHKALMDSTWTSQAKYMIDTINPPKTAEELAAEEFFGGAKADAQEEIDQTGKK